MRCEYRDYRGYLPHMLLWSQDFCREVRPLQGQYTRSVFYFAITHIKLSRVFHLGLYPNFNLTGSVPSLDILLHCVSHNNFLAVARKFSSPGLSCFFTWKFDPYRVSTGFPFSRIIKSSKIWENLFDSPTKVITSLS
jgi:hypothetical protein